MDLFVNYLVYLKNSDIFCIKEHSEEHCQICNNNKIYQHNLHNHFIIIDEQGLSLNSIEVNLNASLVYDGLMICEKCNFGQAYPTSRIYYYIDQFPKFLFLSENNISKYGHIIQFFKIIKKIY